MNKAQSHKLNFRTFIQGRQGEAAWVRPALWALLVLTAAAYIWGLDQSGWSNSFYSAAVQAGTKSWKAFFFGSLDASNFITVDKPPASLWVMEISARIFGLNSWSILIPEALEGVACVWILYITVKRWFGPRAGLLAGAVLATTPVAALMFRFNNPDALLVLLLTASAYAMTRALEAGKTKWLVWASIFIGFGFLAKMLAAFLVIPAFVIVYLVFAPVSVRKRLAQIIISAITVVVSAGWWVAIVQLIPASDRPYIGSSQNNSILNLIFGYNGLGRLSGNESSLGGGGAPNGAVESVGGTTHAFGGGGIGAHFSGATGPFRLFAADMGGQISWLLPAALILFVVALWLVRRNWRTDRAYPAILLWFGVLLVSGIAFSFGQGIIHTYYTVALAPSVGALVGIGTHVLWRRKNEAVARIGLAIAILATVVWSYVLLDRTPSWYPWLRFMIAWVGILASVGVAIGPRISKDMFKTAVAAALVAGLAGPTAYTLDTIVTPHTGSTPKAGPAVAGTGFGRGGFRPGYNSGSNQRYGDFGSGGFGPGSTETNSGSPAGTETGPGTGSSAKSGPSSSENSGRNQTRNGSAGFPGQGNNTPSAAVVKLLQQGAAKYSWVLATSSSMSSAPYQLATGDPVMAIGGFSGSDQAITLAQFKSLVNEGKIHYYLADGRGMGGGFPGGGGNGQDAGNQSNPGAEGSDSGAGHSGGFGRSNVNSQITTWVENNFKTVTVGGVTLYDLTQPKSSS